MLKPVIKLHQDIRWVPAGNWHLTLVFLGNKPVAEVETLLRTFNEAYRHTPNFHFKLSTLERFPNSTGRIVALTAESTRHLDDVFEITRKLLHKNAIEFDLRKLRPHITLGRIKKPKLIRAEIPQPTSINLAINTITLYQSTLTESGSIYTVLQETQLR